MLNREKIASAEIFKGLSQEELGDIAKLCEELILNDGDRVLTEGQRADHLFILETGSVDLRFELPYRETSKEMTVTTIEPGECFAWSALIPPHNATLSCYSAGESSSIKIRGDDLLNLCQKNNHIGFIIMERIATLLIHIHSIYIRSTKRRCPCVNCVIDLGIARDGIYHELA